MLATYMYLLPLVVAIALECFTVYACTVARCNVDKARIKAEKEKKEKC